ncbi:hypothetical protein ABW19_dt0205162 [Dactylella cylindrospora]|nr:hypothetical protein ABW19_dt0205162 [Dactylella cylindrospora]
MAVANLPSFIFRTLSIGYTVVFYPLIAILAFTLFIAAFTILFIVTPSEWVHPYYEAPTDESGSGFGQNHAVQRGYMRGMFGRPFRAMPPRFMPIRRGRALRPMPIRARRRGFIPLF